MIKKTFVDKKEHYSKEKKKKKFRARQQRREVLQFPCLKLVKDHQILLISEVGFKLLVRLSEDGVGVGLGGFTHTPQGT
ncbi:unnamed protein product [Prunus armeniaca]|uniref:Uncharacterized protein n=1 Tax=Prunus armeniaca TaxID=36596 RepID=A0A6J5XFH4_PRUAR|nr:unnamed protein product [Prunus armeniaca]CAB4311367.1 unnamed protein product [Prunus armeniaca]